MTTSEVKKQSLIEKLRSMPLPAWIDEADERMSLYIFDVRNNCEGEKDIHNIDEVAAVAKFLRMASQYDFDNETVKRFIKMYESLEFSGIKGRQRYPMTPIQVFITAGIFGFVQDGRRVVREAIAFIPRKFAKTTYAAALSLFDFLFGDANGEVHIVANAEAQAKIAYKEAKALAMQLDPDGKRIRFTASQFNWKEGQSKSSSVTAHTAGGRTKDGAFASLVIADEYGSATYVKDKSDMADALNVYESSMGPRLNPLTVITTTAGKVIDGPFENKLRQAQRNAYEDTADWQFLLSLHPDEWEMTDEFLSLPRVHKKCNPHIGVTVQSDYYEMQWAKAQGDAEVYKETLTKLFNIFVSNSSRPWITSDEIRKLQTDTRIDDIHPDDGWKCFVGMDFSKGNDLCGMSYLCYNYELSKWYIDCDVWIAEEYLYNHTNSVLYNRWKDAGWLHTSPGKTIDEMLIVDRIAQVNEHVQIVKFGYDPYDAARFRNALAELIRSEKGDPKLMLRSVAQTWGNFNSAVQEMEFLVRQDPPVLTISENPLIPWCFGNCSLYEDRMENVKPVKRTDAGKIDIAIMTLMGIIMQDECEQE